jgi:hypothetical protein
VLSVVLGLARAMLDPVVRRVASAEQRETFVVARLASSITVILVILCKFLASILDHGERTFGDVQKSELCRVWDADIGLLVSDRVEAARRASLDPSLAMSRMVGVQHHA